MSIMTLLLNLNLACFVGLILFLFSHFIGVHVADVFHKDLGQNRFAATRNRHQRDTVMIRSR